MFIRRQGVREEILVFYIAQSTFRFRRHLRNLKRRESVFITELELL